MAITTKGSYYADEGPEIPVPPGYSAPDPHSASVSHQIFEAPSGNNAPSEGFSATDAPKLTRPGGISTEGQNQANAAFDAMGTAP
ncbi:MAG: hypothetical protein ACLP9Y_05480 [Mycobacterium sp.]